jgi:hypothetical protein
MLDDKTWIETWGWRISRRGWSSMEHPAEDWAEPPSMAGVLTDAGTRRERAPHPPQALADAHHPSSRSAGRRLHYTP